MANVGQSFVETFVKYCEHVEFEAVQHCANQVDLEENIANYAFVFPRWGDWDASWTKPKFGPRTLHLTLTLQLFSQPSTCGCRGDITTTASATAGWMARATARSHGSRVQACSVETAESGGTTLLAGMLLVDAILAQHTYPYMKSNEIDQIAGDSELNKMSFLI